MRKAGVLLLAGLLLGGSLCSAGPVLAENLPTPESLAAAKELVSFISSDTVHQMTESMEAQIWPPTERNLRHQIPNIDDATISEIHFAMTRETSKFLDERLPALLDNTAQTYARYFTAAELHEVTAFYNTETGSKLLKVLPKVTAESSGPYLAQLPALGASVGTAVQQILQAHGYIK